MALNSLNSVHQTITQVISTLLMNEIDNFLHLTEFFSIETFELILDSIEILKI